jgi:fused signal recognition particle receptor
MFDGLKEKLGKFRSDAEEAAEENAEAVEDGEQVDEVGEADEPVADDPDDGVESTTEPAREPESTPDAPTAGESGGQSAGETAAAAVDPDDAEPSETADGADPDAPESPETADDGDDSGGATGFARKAKSFAKGRFVIEEEDIEEPLRELEMALIQSDVEVGVAEGIVDGIREELVGETKTFTESTTGIVEDALREALLEVISVGQFAFDERVAAAEKPVVIVFTGVNGVGKTTTIAKLSEYLADRGYSSVLANGDTYRAGANEQIAEHARRLDRKLISHQQGGDPTAVIYDAVEYAEANDVDVVLGDTAGRLHTDEDLMDQLEKIHRVVEPDLTLFVDEAVAGQDATRRAREFDEAATIDGAVLTKADADSQGGAAISIAQVTGKPILFLGTGQDYGDVEPFDPEQMVERLLGDDEA